MMKYEIVAFYKQEIEEIRELYAKYLHIITDEDLVVEYKSVENGG